MDRRAVLLFSVQPPLSRRDGASRLNLGAARRAAPTFGERFALSRGWCVSACRKIQGRDGSPSRPTFAAKPPLSPRDGASPESWGRSASRPYLWETIRTSARLVRQHLSKIQGRDGSPSRPTFAAQPPLSRSNGASRFCTVGWGVANPKIRVLIADALKNLPGAAPHTHATRTPGTRFGGSGFTWRVELERGGRVRSFRGLPPDRCRTSRPWRRRVRGCCGRRILRPR